MPNPWLTKNTDTGTGDNTYATLGSMGFDVDYSQPSPEYTPSSGSGVAGYGGYSWLDMLQQIGNANNQFNLDQVAAVNAFNAAEAQKNRDWQERMSNTAHQREVQDLIAAGLNPILSAHGQGAFTGSGATASGQKAVADNTMSQGFVQLMSAAMSAASAQNVAQIYANATMYAADKQAGSQKDYQQTITDNNIRSTSNSAAIAEQNNATRLISTIPQMILQAYMAHMYGQYRRK